MRPLLLTERREEGFVKFSSDGSIEQQSKLPKEVTLGEHKTELGTTPGLKRTAVWSNGLMVG